MQTFYYLRGGEAVTKEMPSPDAEILTGVPWGQHEVLFTPAYWLAQYWLREPHLTPHLHRIGTTLEEEIVACMLGGYGIPAEVGLAAFRRVRDSGLLSRDGVSAREISACLRQPLRVGARDMTYRFWSQKATYLSSVLARLREAELAGDGKILRDRLLDLPGVGPKTASWIVRNWTGSDEVAILDIHLVRAGRLMGIFGPYDEPSRNYFRMESQFLLLAAGMGVSAAALDALIWQLMRETPRLVASVLRAANAPGDWNQSTRVRLRKG